MALQKTVMTFIGLEAVDAYHRIENVRLPSRTMVVFDLKSYVSSGLEFPAFASKSYSFNINPQVDVWPQAYTYLKTLAEFSDAIDV